MTILLDSDVMIDILRQHPPAVEWLRSLGDTEILLPGYVVMELIQGCRDRSQQELVERRLSCYEVIWPVPDACDSALQIFSQRHLEHGIMILDAMIGATAVAAGLPLYTFNQKHYRTIPSLSTVQPYSRSPRTPVVARKGPATGSP